jgi:ribosomal protein L37AE/L43A
VTTEQTTSIDLSDIAGIEYVCSHCGARYIVPIVKFDTAISSCANCRQEIVSETYKNSSKPSDQAAVHSFVEALRDLSGRGVSIRLTLSCSLRRASDGKD